MTSVDGQIAHTQKRSEFTDLQLLEKIGIVPHPSYN